MNSSKSDILLSNRTLCISLLGNALEFYDLMVYAFFFHVFAHHHLPPLSLEYSELISWLIFALAFLARPIGSFLFGLIGDHFGRKKAITYSMIGISISTLGIGLLPTYSMIGIFAPILLLFFRFSQGFCLGGECNGIAIYLLEQSFHNKRLISSLIVASSLFGAALALVIASTMEMLSLYDWSWRITFIFGSFVGFAAFYLRHSSSETFSVVRQKILTPFFEVFKNHSLSFFVTLFLGGLNGSLCYTLMGYSQQIMLNNSINQNTIYQLTLLGLLTSILTILALGWVGNLFKNKGKPQMLVSCLSSVFLSTLSFNLIISENVFNCLLGMVFLGLCVAILGFDLHRFLLSLFPPSCRYTGTSFAFSIGMAIFGGTTPAIFFSISNFLSNTQALCLYPSLLAVLSSILIFKIDFNYTEVAPKRT